MKPTKHIPISLPVTVAAWTAGLVALALWIASVTVGLWRLPARIAALLAATALLLYALYATAKLTGLAQKAEDILSSHGVLNKLFGDYDARTVVFALGSGLIDVAYAAAEIAAGRVTAQGLLVTGGTYYIATSVVRLGVVLLGARHIAKHGLTGSAREKRAVRTYAATGVSLIVIHTAFAAASDTMLAPTGRFAKYGIMVYVSAVFTFYKIVFAVHGLVRTRNSTNLITRSLRAISTVTAMISIITFQTALLASYPLLGAHAAAVANGITSNIVSAATVALAVSVTARAYRYDRALNAKPPAHEG